MFRTREIITTLQVLFTEIHLHWSCNIKDKLNTKVCIKRPEISHLCKKCRLNHKNGLQAAKIILVSRPVYPVCYSQYFVSELSVFWAFWLGKYFIGFLHKIVRLCPQKGRRGVYPAYAAGLTLCFVHRGMYTLSVHKVLDGIGSVFKIWKFFMLFVLHKSATVIFDRMAQLKSAIQLLQNI